MQDFTFFAYFKYIQAIKSAYHPILRFDEYLRMEAKPDSFAIIRHDVDRRPLKALTMAKLEHGLGVRSTYFFRVNSHVFKPWIIRAIKRLGHEIGYHYENLSDTHGDHALAMKLFIEHLNQLRMYAPVRTIAMHGRPFSRYDNLTLWQDPEIRSKYAILYSILGEVYLDIDYRDIAYICDTGRNWDAHRYNKRDRVESDVTVTVNNRVQLLNALSGKLWRKIIFQVHPERWSENKLEFMVQFFIDTGVNLIKKMI